MVDRAAGAAATTNGARAIFLLEERPAGKLPWLGALEQRFRVLRAASVIGARDVLQDARVVLAILLLANPEEHAARVAGGLRGHKSCERLPLIVLTRSSAEALHQRLASIADVQVVHEARADTEIPALVTSIVARGSAPEPKPAATSAKPPRVSTSSDDSTMWTQQRLLLMFLEGSGERGKRGVELCERLGHAHADANVRSSMVQELRDMLGVLRGEATVLRLRPLTDVLSLADRALERLPRTAPVTLVPKGVDALFTAIRDVSSGRSHSVDLDAIRALFEPSSPA